MADKTKKLETIFKLIYCNVIAKIETFRIV